MGRIQQKARPGPMSINDLLKPKVPPERLCKCIGTEHKTHLALDCRNRLCCSVCDTPALILPAKQLPLLTGSTNRAMFVTKTDGVLTTLNHSFAIRHWREFPSVFDEVDHQLEWEASATTGRSRTVLCNRGPFLAWGLIDLHNQVCSVPIGREKVPIDFSDLIRSL